MPITLSHDLYNPLLYYLLLIRVGIDIDSYRNDLERLKAVFNFLHIFGISNTIFEVNRVTHGIHLSAYINDKYREGYFIVRALCSDDHNRVWIQGLRYKSVENEEHIDYNHVDVLFKAKLKFNSNSNNRRKKRENTGCYESLTYERFMSYLLYYPAWKLGVPLSYLLHNHDI